MLNISSSLLSLVSSRLTVAWTYLTWDAEEPVLLFPRFHLIKTFPSFFQMTLLCYQHPLAELPR